MIFVHSESIRVHSSHKGIRVLSLFDGIATGYYTLNNLLKLDVDDYFSSEIDPDALRVQEQNFPESVTPIGSVCDLDKNKLDELGRIDLLLGGSPCADLSLVNPKRKGLLGMSLCVTDPNGSGILFYEYARIKTFLEAKAKKKGYPFFWIFENTTKMETKSLMLISESLGCSPTVHDSISFVPMKRARNFWGNIPGIQNKRAEGKVPSLQDFLRFNRKAQVRVIPTLTGNCSAQCSGKHKLRPVLGDGESCFLWPIEQEILFGLPLHYTDYSLSETKRRALLGRSWSAHVIQSLLQPLQNIYKIQYRPQHSLFNLQ